MDDQSFEQWSAKLADLRKERQTTIDQELEAKADSFGPTLFFKLVSKSLDTTLDTWFGFERKSWESHPPSDPAAELETMRNEMESTLDFEIEAVQRDKENILSRITWDPVSIEKEEAGFTSFAEELRKKYTLKIRNLQQPADKRRPAEPLPSAVHASSRGGGGGGSSLFLFVMFLVGLLLGGGPSVYFMDQIKKSEKHFQEERSKILNEQRALSDNIGVLHETYEQLALGKIKNLPNLEKEISQLKSSLNEIRRSIESDYVKNRERLLKRTPAGDRLDKALNDLNEAKERDLAKLAARETAALDPLLKQKERLTQLLEQ